MLRRDLRQSYRKEVGERLCELFAGQDMAGVRERLAEIHRQARDSRLFVALHMHAGDGNVHTNIPVHSDNYAMLQEADRVVDRIMRLATGLGGVISGEHGIGLTKVRYLEPDKLAAFADYKRRVDPHNRFNPGKLAADSGLDGAYTPSLRLVAQEAIILEETELGALNDDVKHCLRCGKCKPKCMTHVPRANLNYSPRNKILGTGLIIEAFLYEEQTRRGLSERHFDEMNDVADHCTICHKCLNPCPVDIDYGDVTMRMRRILVDRGKKRTAPAPRRRWPFSTARTPRPSTSCARAWRNGASPGSISPTPWPRACDSLTAPTNTPAPAPASPTRLGRRCSWSAVPSGSNCPSAPSARSWGLRTRPECRSCAIRPALRTMPKRPRRRRRGGVLLPRLRLRAAVLRYRPGHAGHAVRPRRADRAAAGLPLLRLSPACIRPGTERAAHHDGKPHPVPSCRQHAELSRHPHRHRLLRHLHGSAAELRVPAHLPRLPAARHPRIPDGKGRRHRAVTGTNTSTTTPATRR
jgi:ferredoxin